MDPSDWLQGTMCDDGGIGSSSPSSNDILACSRPLMERRLRPPHDQAIKCPRCESTNTKFCYYNNYSLTQPRYFCKTCRRYWTKGGTLRNIPVGGGCRKNKRQSSSGSKKLGSDNQNSATSTGAQSQPNATDLQLCFPEVQLSHHQLSGLIGGGIGASFLDNKYHALLDKHNGYEGFLGSKFDALMGNPSARAHDLLGSTNNIGVDFGGGGDHVHGMRSAPNNFMNTLSSSSSPFGVSFEGNTSGVLDSSYQMLMLPYDYNHNVGSNSHDHQGGGLADVKPSPKLLSLQWQDNNGGANVVGNRESFGYNGGFNGFSSWGVGNILNGYAPSSATNPLI
ncbi:hypothetical protein V2J09_006797 [Rumex salicifolius]